jgi:hypothetical protein
MAHDQGVVGLNPGTIYWMDEAIMLAIIIFELTFFNGVFRALVAFLIK